VADRPRDEIFLVLVVILAFLKPPSALAMSPATDGFSVIMRDLDMGAGNRTHLQDFCKWETFFRHACPRKPA